MAEEGGARAPGAEAPEGPGRPLGSRGSKAIGEVVVVETKQGGDRPRPLNAGGAFGGRGAADGLMMLSRCRHANDAHQHQRVICWR